MTTPIERAAETLHHLGCVDTLYGAECTHNPTEWHSRETLEARAVFESIGRDELAGVIEESFKEWWEDKVLGGLGAHSGDAIIAYLTGDQS